MRNRSGQWKTRSSGTYDHREYDWTGEERALTAEVDGPATAPWFLRVRKEGREILEAQHQMEPLETVLEQIPTWLESARGRPPALLEAIEALRKMAEDEML